VISFQNYNIRGFGEWVGMANFASALYDIEFWYSLWVTLKYAFLFMLFGFTAPIVLAFLLTEVPKGKILYRTIYYLPAVLTGLIVIYLWKSFYGQYGMMNEVVNFFVYILNWLPGVEISELHKNWLKDPQLALICLVLPAVWAGMGPGCLIYLAALKTVPEEIYEAADIDGAGILHKVFHVAIPNIKALIMINFIGVMVGVMKGSGNMALAMTGGGPYTPYGQTEFVGLKIFFQAFGYLRFGVATAMAWILGSMLVGFTVIQLQKLSKMEFKTAAGIK
jgi:multiple sugar transport system permease protein